MNSLRHYHRPVPKERELPPWIPSNDREKRAMVDFVVGELIHLDSCTEEFFQKNDYYAVKVPKLTVADRLQLAKAHARYGNFTALRALYPEISEFINEPKRERGEKRPVDPFSTYGNDYSREVAATVKRIRKIWLDHYGKWKRPANDDLSRRIVAAYLSWITGRVMTVDDVARILKAISR
jgi:hypothetical protein